MSPLIIPHPTRQAARRNLVVRASDVDDELAAVSAAVEVSIPSSRMFCCHSHASISNCFVRSAFWPGCIPQPSRFLARLGVLLDPKFAAHDFIISLYAGSPS